MALDGNFCRSLRDGLLTSFVDASVASEQNLRAQLLANDMSGSGTKVISVLEQELLRCQKFDFSVAFITMGGITPLLQTFKELEARGIKGRILTTNYLMFTDPRALEKLAGLSNIEIKFFRTEEAGQTGFHTKGYIFDRGRLRSIIVGSSNLTQTALTVNQEWNARLVSAAEGEFARQIQTEFDVLWEHPASHALEDVLDDYRIEYEQTKTVRRAFFSQEPTLAGELAHHEIRPNAMQKRLADNLLTLMRKEEPGADITVPKKGLLISATGTGKTYASAFALKAIQPKRALFLVHREQIARKSLESYRHVMGQSYTYGVFIGQQQETDRDIVFATIQTMVKHRNDGTFAPTGTTTRAQIVQILYNLEGTPAVSGTTPFADLTANWYKPAILWAYQNNVVAGTSATTFAPDQPVTREQIAVILTQYMFHVLKMERTWTPADLSTFPDGTQVSSWAKEAMQDAVALGLINGTKAPDGKVYLDPQGSAARQQVATILMNFCQNVKK